jgi:dTDP-glucose pyrophosphorylase
MKNFSGNLITQKETIRDALLKLDKISHSSQHTLFVLNDDKQLIGTVTHGDIRRALLNNSEIDKAIVSVMNSTFSFLQMKMFTLDEIKTLKEREIQLVPLLDENKRILRVINLREKQSILPLDAFILAGGKGERLMPLTANTPKALLKVGDKPILEHNIDRLKKFGINNVMISVRHLSEQITSYFGNGDDKNLNISFVHEKGEPLGTIGSVSMVNEFANDAVLIMNSDLLTNIDFENLFVDFLEKKADMIVATIPYHVQIPYAVIETDDEKILSFKEKPTYTYYSNAGIYIVKKDLLRLIPVNQHFNATDFMALLIEKNYKVAYYPILAYWLDIGKNDDYKKAQEDIKHIRL